MASDDLVWNIIGNQFCSYKVKTTKNQTFCRNEYNVTGLCTKQSCPLSNSRYATLRPHPETGVLYLYIKTIERSHLPNRWWQRIKLSANYATALSQIDAQLIYWPKFLVHKCKQRLTRLTQVAIRTRKLAREQERLGERLVPKLASKVRRREETRERKAEAAAKVERAIERVLVERLRSGAYGDRPLNVEPNVWKKVMKGLERSGEATRDQDLDDGIEEEVEEIEGEYEKELADGEAEIEYVSDVEGESDDEGDDMEDFDDWMDGESADEESGDEDEEDDQSGSGSEGEDEDEGEEVEALKKALGNLKRKRPAAPPPKPKKKAAKGPRREIMYEIEREPAPRQTVDA